MNILREGDPRPSYPSAAAVGFFDGVHRGHQFLLENVKALARQNNLSTMAITFAEHPLTVLRPESPPLLLTTTDERLNLIESRGIDSCALLSFTKNFSALSAKDFMREYLVEKLNVKALVVGYDHSLGHDDDTSFEHYRLTGESLGINVVRASRYVTPNGLEVSSTSIRKALAGGCVELAAKMLGRRYVVSGKIVHGRHVGTGLGFPTANLDAAETAKVIPGKGVYAAIVRLKGKSYASVVSIGTRPTIGNGEDTTVEAHIINFNGDIYGENMSIEFVIKLREEMKFDSVETLRQHIALDVAKAEAVLSKFS